MPNRRIRRDLVETTLGAQLNPGDTTITLAAPLRTPDGTDLPTLGANEEVSLTVGVAPNREIVTLTDYTTGATTGTIVRAQSGTTALTHVNGRRVVLTPTTEDYVAPEEHAVGIGLGARSAPPPWSTEASGLVAGHLSSVEDGYGGYTVLGRAHMYLGPNGWQDGIAIGDGAKASGEAFAIGTGAQAFNYGSFFLTDYPTGQPGAGDVAIGAYIDLADFDGTTLGYSLYDPPSNIALRSSTRTDPSSQFAADAIPYYYVKLIGPSGQSGAPESVGSQFVAAGDVVDITFNDASELGADLANLTEVRLYAQYDTLGDFDLDWILVDTVTNPASFPVQFTDDGSAFGNEPDPNATAGWMSSGSESARVVIGYSTAIAAGATATDGVSVGARNTLGHERAVLLGPGLSSDKDDQVKVGGANHVLTAPGGLELATVTATSAYTIDATDKQTVVLADTTGGAFDVTLPAAASGRTVIVKRTDGSANALNVVTPGAETIDGNASHALPSQYDVVRLVSDGTDWFVI